MNKFKGIAGALLVGALGFSGAAMGADKQKVSTGNSFLDSFDDPPASPPKRAKGKSTADMLIEARARAESIRLERLTAQREADRQERLESMMRAAKQQADDDRLIMRMRLIDSFRGSPSPAPSYRGAIICTRLDRDMMLCDE